jgi:hypothetical protein
VDDVQFWGLIKQAQRGTAASASPENMAAVLKPLSNEEVSAFGLAFYLKLCDLNQWRLWGAGYVIAGGMGDDAFHYFRSWIVGKGEQVFDIAMQNPDELGPYIDDPEVDNELLEYITLKVLESRGSDEDPRDRADRSPDRDTLGEPFDEDTVGNRFPKLTSLFG